MSDTATLELLIDEYPQTIDKVLDKMERLGQGLVQTKLHNLVAFNDTYVIITKNVMAKISQGYFDNDTRMEQIDVRFAAYYFTALNTYLKGQPAPPAWRLLFEACASRKLTQSMFMALGVNAHVNNDLAQTMRDVGITRQDKADFERVNDLLAICLHEVIYNLQESPIVLNGVKNLTLPLYRRQLLKLITQWRGQTWDNAMALSHGLLTQAQIEDDARVLAERMIGKSLASLSIRPSSLRLYVRKGLSNECVLV